jgi:tetratricopeptide (TPR) repeat protein
LPQIAKALGVDYVLEGSVRKAGAQVRITAQLIRVAGDAHLWSDSWTRDLADVFAVQEDIARQVARELQARLTHRDEARLARVGTRDPAAYQDFLRARQLWSQRSVASLNAAVEAFQSALARDPGFADAWAGLAQTWAILPEYTGITADNQDWVVATYAQALDAAGRALALDPASSRALAARAYVKVIHEFDWVQAEADFRAALAADPRDAGARQWYGELLAYQRRWDEAHAQYDAALALDPLAPILHASYGIVLAAEGRPADAIPLYEEARRLAPEFVAGAPVYVYALAEAGQFDRAGELAPGMPVEYRLYVEAKRDPSRTEAAVQSILAHGLDSMIGKPLLLASLGRHDLALVEIERLYALGDPYRVFLYCMTTFDPLHADPRFQALLAQIGLPRPAAYADGDS